MQSLSWLALFHNEELCGMTDPRADIPNWVCSGNAVVKKKRKHENIWAVQACCSEAVSAALEVHLAQFEKQSTKGM